MNLNTFNAALAIGWLLIALGVGLHDIGAGLAVGGVLLLGLTFMSVRLCGLVQPPNEPEKADEGGAD